MIIEYTKKAEAQYNAQIKLMGAESAGHIWLNEEVAATKDLQKQFDDYLSTFRTTISYAAQAYGFYFEVNRLCEHMGSLSKQISEAPANAIAVAPLPWLFTRSATTSTLASSPRAWASSTPSARYALTRR